MVTDTACYFAKATMPPGNTWRSPWSTKDSAVNAAKKYVRDWLSNGLDSAEACVFFRSGAIDTHINKGNCDQ